MNKWRLNPLDMAEYDETCRLEELAAAEEDRVARFSVATDAENKALEEGLSDDSD